MLNYLISDFPSVTLKKFIILITQSPIELSF